MSEISQRIQHLMGVTIAATILCGVVQTASASPVTLSDLNAVAIVDPQTGITSWTIDGVSQLKTQSFYYRIGATGPEHLVSNLGVLSTRASDINGDGNNDTLNIVYGTTNGLQINLTYTLTGGDPDSGTADIAESVRLSNKSTTSMALHFFQYTNLALAGGVGGDTVQIENGNTAIQSHAGRQFDTMSYTADVPPPTNWEVGYAGETLGKLTDGVASDLSGASVAVGPGDVTWAFQWDQNVASKGSLVLSGDMQIGVVPPTVNDSGNSVPLPAASFGGLALLSAMSAWRILRRR